MTAAEIAAAGNGLVDLRIPDGLRRACAMTEAEALAVALDRMAQAESVKAVECLIHEAIAAAQDGDPRLRDAVRRLGEIRHVGPALALEILAAVGRLEGWES